jgi:hypothetical protein
MTGTGTGGNFEKDMLKTLKTDVGGWASQFRTLKTKPGQPAFPISSANQIAVAAQREVERYFAPYIQSASRIASAVYHPGTYSLTSKLGDESTRPITVDDRQGWTDYWMTLRDCGFARCGQAVLDAFNCVPTRTAPDPDQAEFTRVRDLFVAANATDIDDAIHGWPAEAGSGTVFIQPYVAGKSPNQLRSNRWELFTTLIHELMHVLAHPNFTATADKIGGTASKYLGEGFVEVMRHELWDGPGQLAARLGTPEMASLRKDVEGATYPYDPSLVVYHPDYAEYADAKKIVAAITPENARAAFFLGHTELLGLGAGTASGAPLTGVAMYSATASADAEVIIAGPSDTEATIRQRTNAQHRGVHDASGPIYPGTPIAAGTKVTVPGIRHVIALKDDTLRTIARQNHVTTADLIKANQLAPGTADTFAFPTGWRVLIPIHTDMP